MNVLSSRAQIWLRRVFLGGVFVFVFAAVGGATYERFERRRVAAEFPPSGMLLEVDGRRSHVHCQGAGSPTVILEAGFDSGGSLTWSTVQGDIATISRVCSYDRAGMLWSDRRTEPRDAHLIADELHAILAAAGERPPYVMVGHSLGGLLIRVFDERFPGEAAGFVFVDSSHPDQISRFPSEVRRESGRTISRIELVLASIGIARLTSDPPSDSKTAHAIRNLPGIAAEMAAIPEIFAQSRQAGSLGDRPVVVLTAGLSRPNPGWDHDVNDRFRATWLELQAELAALSTNSKHRTVTGATHNIQVDDPPAVIAAVRDVIVAVESGGPVRAARED